MEVKKLRFDEIEVADRLRDIDGDKLDRMRISMEVVGQLTPIEVLAQPGKQRPYLLIYGYHRKKAAQMAGLDGIDAIIYAGDADVATLRLREIDENLARADLSQYDKANFIAERARLWEAVNDKIKPGPTRKRNYRQVGGFTAEVCQQFGLSKREIERHRTRTTRIIPQLWAALRGTAAADNGSFLDAIARLPDLVSAPGHALGDPKCLVVVCLACLWQTDSGDGKHRGPASLASQESLRDG